MKLSRIHIGLITNPSASIMLYYVGSNVGHPNYHQSFEGMVMMSSPRSIIMFFMSLQFKLAWKIMGYFLHGH